jgi:hypothetical protein
MSPAPRSPEPTPDIRRLAAEGHAVWLGQGRLVVGEVPYVDQRRRVCRGTLVCLLELAGDVIMMPRSHIAYFAGDVPCDAEGRPLRAVTPNFQRDWGGGLVTDHMMCTLPPAGAFSSYHEMVTTMVAILAGHAEAIDPLATVGSGRLVVAEGSGSPFAYVDTASSRVGIGGLAARFDGLSVGILGLGGTGGYVLDLVAKTPVSRIHLIDGDEFRQHNSFRAPGAASVDDLRARRAKVEHFDRIYSAMHRGIVPHPVRLGPGSLHLLSHLDFAFVCLDDPAAKPAILAELERLDVPYIDVGMGLEHTGEALTGAVRVTASTPAMRAHVRERSRVPMAEPGVDDPYASNVQVADLNALNAALAVVRWKKWVGFYADLEREHFSVYSVDGNHLLNEDLAEG